LKINFSTFFGKKQKSAEHNCKSCGVKFVTDQDLEKHNAHKK
jgi:hypothetical protein